MHPGVLYTIGVSFLVLAAFLTGEWIAGLVICGVAFLIAAFFSFIDIWAS